MSAVSGVAGSLGSHPPRNNVTTCKVLPKLRKGTYSFVVLSSQITHLHCKRLFACKAGKATKVDAFVAVIKRVPFKAAAPEVQPREASDSSSLEGLEGAVRKTVLDLEI